MKKKFYQKKWFIALVIIFVLSMIFGTSETENNEDNTKGTVQTEQHTEVTEENHITEIEVTEENLTIETEVDVKEDNTEDDISIDEQFVESVKVAIQDDISNDDEKIIDVTLNNKELRVFVDFSQKDPSPFTLEDIAIIRTSSITDAILDLTEYMDLWDTIVVDFGSVGYIKNNKEQMTQNEYGMYYFPTENFKLEK